jgi:putative DNA primase/helicase
MVSLAQSELPVTPKDLDQHPWLLTVRNGTLDLQTAERREHSRDDLITKLAPVEYDPKATCPRWDAFLNEIFKSDHELVAYVQRVIGYALTGSTKEQCYFILYGTGANGKSTLLETVKAILGDYAKTTPTETLLLKRGERISNDVARLHGARFVSATEAESNKRLAEALMKQLTGEDAVTARFLHQEFFEFAPAFKMFLAVNHLPVIQSTDPATWRRIHRIPFDVTFLKDKQDKTLREKLLAELPGILAWAVRGCLDWQQHGLNPPGAVVKATAEYKSAMDTLAMFLNECCMADHNAWTATMELYQAYTAWCDETRTRPITMTDFGAHLSGLMTLGGEKKLKPEFGKFKDKKARGWRGIALSGEDA